MESANNPIFPVLEKSWKFSLYQFCLQKFLWLKDSYENRKIILEVFLSLKSIYCIMRLSQNGKQKFCKKSLVKNISKKISTVVELG